MIALVNVDSMTPGDISKVLVIASKLDGNAGCISSLTVAINEFSLSLQPLVVSINEFL